IVQFLPLILVPLILILYPGKEKKYFWAVILIYVAAKIFEIADEKIFSSLHFISGHTLKHLVASLIALPILYKIKKTTISKNTNRNHFST
ncbi:MAG TPA: alkaline phytoceramidase, partial [Bacteroidia bacterium]|nr:alkaline phytoceramidase [Bacteroidia bacterium]